MKRLSILLLLSSMNIYAAININLNKSITDSSKMNFETHIGPEDSYANVLALNVEYKQIKGIRKEIEQVIKRPLKFLRSWKAEGEAHVTTITPPEYKNVLRHFVSISRINEIAQDMDIQSSNLTILGIGSGKVLINNIEEETFFLIVDSMRLRSIRHAIYKEFIQNGGNPKRFDPSWFFPHITIGYTKKDLHEFNGVIKNINSSLDVRFKVIITDD